MNRLYHSSGGCQEPAEGDEECAEECTEECAEECASYTEAAAPPEDPVLPLVHTIVLGVERWCGRMLANPSVGFVAYLDND